MVLDKVLCVVYIFTMYKGRTPRFCHETGAELNPQVVINNTPCCNDRVEEQPEQFFPQQQPQAHTQAFVHAAPTPPQNNGSFYPPSSPRELNDCTITICSSGDSPYMRIEKLRAVLHAAESQARLCQLGVMDDSLLCNDLVFLKPKPVLPPPPPKPKIWPIVLSAIAGTAIILGGAAILLYSFVLS